MINAQEEAIKALVAQSKTAATRTQLVPEVTADPVDPPPGLVWIRSDEGRAYLKTSTATLMIASATPTSGGSVVAERSLPASALMLNTLTSDELGPDSVGATELGPGAVTGDSFDDIVSATTSLSVTSPQPVLPALTLDVDFDHVTDILRVQRDGVQRVRVDKDRFAIGTDLPGAAVSIQTGLTDTALRIRGSGGAILAERQNGALIFSVDASGNATFAGAVASLSGNSNTQGTQSIQGALTVSDQTNLLAGLSVTGRTDLRAEVDIDGRVTFNAEPFLPADYSVKVGEAVHLRTVAGTDNRVVFEGVESVGVAELQLGTGGPVLRGDLSDNDVLYVNGEPVLTGSVGGLTGSQMARDTITGATGPGVGNIAAETITGYNIKNGSITSTELSLGAVVQAAIAEGAVGPIQLADGSVIDRVVASMGVGKLISGTLNADEIFMGPSGHIYLGPQDLSEINGERVQLDSSGIRAYSSFNIPLAEFTPGGFTLRTGVDGARLEFDAATGLELFGLTGERTGYLSPLGEFQLASLTDGASMRMNSNEGILFTASATKNLAYNPGFLGGSEFQTPVGAEASDDQTHVFAGEYAVKFRSTNPNVTAPSYVDVPLKNSIGTGQSVTRVRVNYCPNPSVETAATGWTSTAPTNVVGTYGPALGFIRNRAVWVVATAAGEASVAGPVVTTTGGMQWALSASVRVSTAQNVTANIIWYNINNAVVRTDVSTPVALKTNVVTQVGLVALAPTNATSFRLSIKASLSNTDKLEVSNLLYDRNSGIDAYFDGFSDGYRWDGTPGNSTSSLVPVAVLDSQNNLVSIFAWTDVTAWVVIEGRDGTAGVGRGASLATRLIPHQWSRISVQCVGRMDRVRLHYPAADAARQARITTSPVWFSGLQVEADKDAPTPFCSGNEPGCRWEGLEGKSASIRDRDVVVTQISPDLGTTVSGAIVGGSLTSASFFAGRIFGTEITGGTITGAILRGNLISGDQILAGTISGTSLTARSITADQIAFGSIEGDLIKANSITGDKVTAATITGTNIAGRSITGDKFVAGTVSANELAARSITADKLQADLVLSSRLIAGAATTGARVEMAAGTGLQAFTAAGVRTFLLEAGTGRAFFMGQLATATSGQRIEINPGNVSPDTIRFYPFTTSNYSSIDAVSWGNGAVSGIRIVGSGTDVAANRGMVLVRDQYASLLHGKTDLTYWGAEVYVEQAFTRNKAAVVDLIVDERLTPWGGGRRVAMIHYDTGGNPISPTQLQYEKTTFNGGEPFLIAVGQSSGLVFAPGKIYARSNGNTGFIPFVASNVAEASGQTMKKQIRDLDGDFDSLAALRGAKARKFKFRNENKRKRMVRGGGANTKPVFEDVDIPDEQTPTHIGFVAEELPSDLWEYVDGVDGTPFPAIYPTRIIATLWDVTQKLLARIEALEAQPPRGGGKK